MTIQRPHLPTGPDDDERIPLRLPKKKSLAPSRYVRGPHAFSAWLARQAADENSPWWSCGVEAGLVRGATEEHHLYQELCKVLDAKLVRDCYIAFEREVPR